MREFILYFIIILFAIIGCASKKVNETAELNTVIAKYNNALIEAYRNQFFESLKEVAAEEEVRRIDTIVSAYLQGNQLMEAELHRIDFKEIKITGDEATARASEDWSYRWINYKTGREVELLKDIHYEIIYHLIKEDNRWKVKKTEELEAKKST